MNRIDVLRGLIATLDRKIKSVMLQSDLGLRTYEEICAVDEAGARQVETSLVEMASYIAQLERDRLILTEMLQRAERR